MQTLAYLLPTVQRILNSQKLEVQVRPGRDVGIVIIAPTRELAQQISREAESLLNFQHGWTVQSVTGGTSLSRDKARLWHQQCAPTILVATPGRLLDLLQSDSKTVGLSDTGDRRNRQLANLLRNTPIVILDEADLLLQGFQKEMTKILSYFPRVEKRQTMLFSATTPAKLLGLLSSTAGSHIISKEYVFVDCVGVGDDAKLLQTNRRVDHCYIQLDCMEHYLAGLLSILRDAVLGDSLGKIIVFFPTAKLVTFAAELLKSFFVPNDSSIRERRVQILSIHSRMSHGARQRASSLFRVSDDRHTSILLTSDVSARGVDYGDVNLVIQVSIVLHRLVPLFIFVQSLNDDV